MVLWVLWLTYGSFYFCRNNLGVALPGLGAELGYSKAQLGTVLMALKLAYASGQFINGQLAERFSPRKLLAAGLLTSAVLNVIFGWGSALYFLTFVWACNGYVQALGWTPTMRVTANWFGSLKRGRAIGIIATGYQLCGALTFVVAGWAAEKFGWRGALYVPAGLLVASAVHMLFFLEERPEHNEPAPKVDQSAGHGEAIWRNLALTLCNPALWFVAVTLGLLDACRYGFTDWGVTHLKEVQATSVGSAAFKYAVLPCGGMLGAYLSGWATDRFFGGRRGPVICVLLILLAVLAVAYIQCSTGD
jgi:sugar phosphate permease